jgi:uncharacterized coiled-coil DUF342 family protein
MSRHFVTLRFIPGEYRDFDAKDGVFECSVDVHSVIAQLEEGGWVASMEELEKLECERDNECERADDAEAEVGTLEATIQDLRDTIDDLEAELREAREEIQEMLDGP